MNKDFFEVVEGETIYISKRAWVALVLLKIKQTGRLLIRLYKWETRKGVWKVALAKMTVHFWDFEEITKRIAAWKKKYPALVGKEKTTEGDV